MAALEAHLEIKILNQYIMNIERALNEPLVLYTKFFSPIFKPFSYSIDSSKVNGAYEKMKENTVKNIAKYHEELNK